MNSSTSITDALLIESLNNMYNQNIRVIENLNYQNNEIRNALVQLSNSRRTNFNQPPRDSNNNYRSRDDSRRENNRRNRTNHTEYRGSRPNTEQFNTDVRRALVNTINRNNGRQNTTHFISPVANRPRMDSISYADVSSNYLDNTSIDTYASYIIREFFTPVNVYPTQEQINRASRIVRYGDIVRPTNTTCPITLETFNDNSEVTIIRHCGHAFNTDDFNSWFRINCRCPVCRYDIRDYTTDPDASVVREVEQDSITDNTINTTLDQVFSQNPTRIQYSIYRLFDSSNNSIY